MQKPDDLAADADVSEEADEVSLERLSQAFAEAMGRSAPSTTPASADEPGEATTEQTEEEPTVDSLPEGNAESAVSPLSVLEAMLFVGHPRNEPLTAERAARLMRGVEPEEVHELVQELNRRYEAGGCPYHVVSEGTGYLLVLRDEFHRLRNKFYGQVRAARLSQAAVEVLSLVAYNQPVTRDDIDRLRGIHSGPILTQLVRRRLLRIERTDAKPRKTLYYSTPRFLALLGLESLEDLPQALDLNKR
jgi:segregation and condensation protein B